MLVGWDQTIYSSNARARRNFCRAVRERGYEPLAYSEREKLKREGWREVHDQSLPLPARVAGAEKVLRARYDGAWRPLTWQGSGTGRGTRTSRGTRP